MRIPNILPKEDLADVYFARTTSAKVIARRYGVSQSCIDDLFARHGLKPRTLKNAMFLRRKPLTRYKRPRPRVLDKPGERCVHCGCDDSRAIGTHRRLGKGGEERRGVEATDSGTTS